MYAQIRKYEKNTRESSGRSNGQRKTDERNYIDGEKISPTRIHRVALSQMKKVNPIRKKEPSRNIATVKQQVVQCDFTNFWKALKDNLPDIADTTDKLVLAEMAYEKFVEGVMNTSLKAFSIIPSAARLIHDIVNHKDAGTIFIDSIKLIVRGITTAGSIAGGPAWKLANVIIELAVNLIEIGIKVYTKYQEYQNTNQNAPINQLNGYHQELMAYQAHNNL